MTRMSTVYMQRFQAECPRKTVSVQCDTPVRTCDEIMMRSILRSDQVRRNLCFTDKESKSAYADCGIAADGTPAGGLMSGEPEAPGMRQQGVNGPRGIRAGSCHVWPLPANTTCATVARQVFRDAVSEVGLEPDLLDDCVLMASELAANTLHAHAVAGTGGGGDRLVSVAPDMGGEPISSAGPAPHTQ